MCAAMILTLNPLDWSIEAVVSPITPAPITVTFILRLDVDILRIWAEIKAAEYDREATEFDFGRLFV